MIPLLAVLPLLTGVLGVTTTPNTGDQPVGFLFDYVRAFNTPLPVMESCPNRLTFAPVTIPFGGAEPAPPFTAMFLVSEAYLDPNGSVETRTYTYSTSFTDGTVPNTVDLPLMNGTQFMVCMWAANGISGGCQDLYSVYPSPAYAEAYADPNATCRGDTVGSWVPPTERRLQVDVFGENGVVAERAWPASCSDLQFIPKSGTAPYTLLISPAMHPPVNITSNTTFAADNSMNYTIRLTHGQPFWATVLDKNGATWSSGPYHAGTNQNVGCLATLTGQDAVAGQMSGTASPDEGGGGVSTAALGGGIAGAFVVGALLAALVMLFLAKKKKRSHKARNGSTDSIDGYNDTRPSTWRADTHASIVKPQAVTPYTDQSPLPEVDGHVLPYGEYQPNPRTSMAQLQQTHSIDGHDRAYRHSVGLGDFQPVSSNPRGTNSISAPSAHSDSGGGPTSPPMPSASGSGSGGRQVYVVHSDGGGNVHIQLPDNGASVVELPPNYQNAGIGSSTGAGSASGAGTGDGTTSPREEKSRMGF